MNSVCLFNEMISLSSLKVEGSCKEDRNVQVNLKISHSWLANNKKELRIDLSDPEYVEFLYFETFTEEKNFTISSYGQMLNVDFDSFTRHIVQFMNLTLQRSPTDSTELKCVLKNENDICRLEFFFLRDEFESFTINLRAECIHGLCDHAIKRVKTLLNENERQARTIAFLEDEIETIERKTGKYNREMEGKLRDADRKIQKQADRIVYLEDSLNRGNNRVVEGNVRFASPAPCEEEFTWGQKIEDFDSQYIAANKSSPLLNHLWGVCNED